MDTIDTVITYGTTIFGVTLIVMGILSYTFEVLPLEAQQQTELNALVNSFPTLTNQTDLSIDQRIELLKTHHVLSVEQDTTLILMQNRHEAENLANNDTWLILPGLFIPILGWAFTISRDC